MHLGNKIRFLRGLKGLSQENMAKALDMSLTGYAKIEQGKTDLPYSRLQDIATALDIKPEDLIAFNEQMVFQNCENSQFGYTYNQYVNDFQKEREAHLSHIETLKQENLQKQQTIESQNQTIATLNGIIKNLTK